MYYFTALDVSTLLRKYIEATESIAPSRSCSSSSALPNSSLHLSSHCVPTNIGSSYKMVNFVSGKHLLLAYFRQMGLREK